MEREHLMLEKEKQGGPGKVDLHVICVKRVDWVLCQVLIVSAALFFKDTS